MKVLTVDNSPANIDILGHILKQNGLNVSLASNVEIEQKRSAIGPDCVKTQSRQYY